MDSNIDVKEEVKWSCPKCKTDLRETGVRLIHVGASVWEEWFGTGDKAWYVDGDGHGDGNSTEIECLKCNCELPDEMGVQDDIEENWC